MSEQEIQALLFAFLVLFPRAYPVSVKEIDSIKAMQHAIVSKKKRYFTLSVFEKPYFCF